MGTVGSLRVASANAASGRDHRTGRPDLETWVAALARLDADVVAVQEVDHLLARSGGVDQTAEIAQALADGGAAWTTRFAAAVHGTPGARHTFRPAPRTDPHEPSYGVALLSRHPVLAWWELRMRPSLVRLPVPLPPGAPRRVLWAPDEQRVAVAGRVDGPAGAVTVVCTHLSFAPVRATGQLRELRRWSATLPRPLLLLGDLNLPGRWPSRVTGWSALAGGRTYPAARPRVQLDHALLDDPHGRLEPVGHEIVPLGHGDHLAVLVALRRAATSGRA